ncbi:MAG: uridine kinase [Oscillospiraceae bacterium]
MKKINASTIKKKLKENPKQFINDCEKAYNSQIKSIAYGVHRWGDEKPILLLSGPSGSGKTTTALKLSEYLNEMGTRTFTVSMDDYFKSISTEEKSTGNVDFESPYRLDIDLLNEHMKKIANCEEITLPDFNFKDQKRLSGPKFKRQKGDFVIFEGIHALNPDVTGLTDGISSGIYVSVRTRIESKSGAQLHPEYIRLMRRIIRDKQFRGRTPMETIAMFQSVKRGEELYILPYKDRAEYTVDSFIPYEAAVYKHFLEGELDISPESCENYQRYILMQNVLKELNEIDESNVPEKSLIREFIGGSGFSY